MINDNADRRDGQIDRVALIGLAAVKNDFPALMHRIMERFAGRVEKDVIRIAVRLVL